MNTCPNCGAQITGGKCEYCGTVFDDNHDRYELSSEQKSYFSRLYLINQMNRLNAEKQDLELKLLQDKLVTEARNAMVECCCEQPKKRWWRR